MSTRSKSISIATMAAPGVGSAVAEQLIPAPLKPNAGEETNGNELYIAADTPDRSLSGLNVLKAMALVNIWTLEKSGDASAGEIEKLSVTEAQLDVARRAHQANCIVVAVPPSRQEILEAIAAWKPRTGPRAIDLAYNLVSDVPEQDRPFAHEVRAANFRFYSNIYSQLSRAGVAFGSLFPVCPGASGGALSKRGLQAKAAETDAQRKRRERQRNYMRARRAGPGPG